ncbi:hypothetical protein MODO_3613 [Myroides odoratimimus]|uniref:hypothetical protein n=1 Tax=Myroides odoratimimus TaxID=76832 RepID=UPI00072B4E95|nr:hypothetical protein [Myroides odoratimimus]MDM1396904.1 hypothetical protein [Myroides odoratimimus]MDM1453753.1 hypothetical protein [Myroides odoratimimus]MDM1477475.1 hypothetical protein [Myroides odoratimimus]MDM1489705.1 hypothetical protein [Myroides odoratimimus]MDM1499217.1 hypothetical protein [Myroides odoratimimus]
MKKITLLAVLLGTTYFANAQVGIGTPDPATSAELDIVAKAGNKGILIPRVALKNTTEFQMAGKVAESTSLLVFNKTEVKNQVPTGFYYWDGAKWNRIVGKEELDTVIKNLGDNITNITTKLESDVKNLQAVVNYILPSNPDNKDDKGNPVVTEKHTTIVYNPETKEMFYVTYDNGKYTTNQIDITKMVQGVETNTFFKDIKDANGKTTGYVYFNEKTIVEAIDKETDPAKIKDILDKLDGNTKGAIKIDVKGTVVNNFKEILEAPTTITVTTKDGDKTFTTVEEYLQYISQSADGNVIYKNLGDTTNPNWVFQYYDKATGKYETIVLRDLVAETESKTTIVTYENKQYYLSEAYIVGGGELDVTKWTAVPAGAIHVDVVGGVINNIEEILTTKGNITIQVGGKDMNFTSVEEYLQYITQFSEGNVIYKNISTDSTKPNWVLQYWDNTANEYKTINLTDLVASVETKTNILRAEATADKTLSIYEAVVAPVQDNVKKGEIFYKYNNEDKGEQFINMTADIISSINNNEEVKNALTNILNQGGNVYFGDHDNDAATDNVFYTMKIVNGKEVKTPIELPASFLLKIINDYKEVIKQALGDNITNEGDIVFTGNIYNGRQVLLAKGSTKANGESARTEGVTLENATGDNAINGVLSIKVLKAGVVVTESTKDVVVSGTKIDFNIGVGNIYTALPKDTYEVVVEYLGKEVKPTTQP